MKEARHCFIRTGSGSDRPMNQLEKRKSKNLRG
jgi:hypothetical protein